jgi:2-methylcitrate dehydratase
VSTDPGTRDATRPPYDPLFVEIAGYTLDHRPGAPALAAAHWVLLDSLACAFLALDHEPATRHLGPFVPGTVVPHGARVPGTPHVLDPVKAAYDTTLLIRWLDFNDTWLAREWGHPSDNLGAILAVSDHLDRSGRRPLRMADVLDAAVRAHEIQGVLALGNSLNEVGLDHVTFVRLASAAVATRLLGGDRAAVARALSQVIADGGPLRVYRQAPNTGPRKSWAAADATSRAVRHAHTALTDEPGYPSALSAPRWGFEEVLLGGAPLTLPQPLGDYVIERVLFKVAFPAEFHAQTAAEAAIALHPQVRDRVGEVERIEITTHASAIRIIDKTGPLANPADRDHCLQYITAVGLLYGELTARHYEDDVAADPRIDALRDRMRVAEDPRYSRDYLDPDKRSIANAVQVCFTDGTSTPRREVEYPIGHPRRRAEALPLLRAKLAGALLGRLPPERADRLLALADDPSALAALPVSGFVDLLVP